MKVLIVNMSVDAVLGGGTVERTRQLAKELHNFSDTETKIFSTTAGLKDQKVFKNDQCVLLPCLNERWYVPMPCFGTIYRSLKWADVVIIMNHWTLLNAMVYMMNKVVKRPYLFCPAGALHVFGRSGVIKKVYSVIVGQAILKHANAVVAIPDDERALFHRLGVSKNRTVVIPNGISPKDFEHCDTIGVRVKYQLGAAPFLLFVGRLNEIKGPDILLDAFIAMVTHFPDWHLAFAGPDGGLEEALRATARKRNLESHVHFLGFISGDEKSDLYHAAQILVVPSRLEAMSIVALEAGICATPVVMTDVCGFTALVDAGGGVEVPVGISAIAEALQPLMLDSEAAKSMGLKGKVFIEENYTWKMSAAKHRDLCMKVCGGEV